MPMKKQRTKKAAAKKARAVAPGVRFDPQALPPSIDVYGFAACPYFIRAVELAQTVPGTQAVVHSFVSPAEYAKALGRMKVRAASGAPWSSCPAIWLTRPVHPSQDPSSPSESRTFIGGYSDLLTWSR